MNKIYYKLLPKIAFYFKPIKIKRSPEK